MNIQYSNVGVPFKLYGYSIFSRWKMLYVGKIKFTEQHIIHTFRHQEIESAIQDIAYRS